MYVVKCPHCDKEFTYKTEEATIVSLRLSQTRGGGVTIAVTCKNPNCKKRLAVSIPSGPKQ